MPFIYLNKNRPLWISQNELDYRAKKDAEKQEKSEAAERTEQELAEQRDFKDRQREYLRKLRTAEKELTAWNDELGTTLSYVANLLEIPIHEAGERWNAGTLDLTPYGLDPMPTAPHAEKIKTFDPHYPTLSYESFNQFAKSH